MPNLITRNTLSSAALGMIGVGLWWIYPPASLVAVGLIIYGTILVATISAQGSKGE